MKKIIIVLVAMVGFNSLMAQSIRKIRITDLEKTIAESKTPLIVNFWATFCVPCIEEIPFFQEEVKKHAKDSVQLLLVSLDLPDYYPNKIQQFAKKKKFTATIEWLDETNADYFCPKVDPKWSGAIPATLFINNKLGYRKFIEEPITHDELKAQLIMLLSPARAD